MTLRFYRETDSRQSQSMAQGIFQDSVVVGRDTRAAMMGVWKAWTERLRNEWRMWSWMSQHFDTPQLGGNLAFRPTRDDVGQQFVNE